MENQNAEQSLFGLNLNDNVKTQLRGAASIAGVAAILSLVSSVIGIIRAVLERNKVVTEFNNYEGFAQTRIRPSGSGLVLPVISFIVSILLFYFLNRFSNQTKQGLAGNNQELMNNGLGNLSYYFITIGILIIIFLAFMLLAIMLML